MKIIAATVIQQRQGADIVSLRTDLPEACHPYKESLDLEFRCAKGKGVLYLITHFPDVVIEHISPEPLQGTRFSDE